MKTHFPVLRRRTLWSQTMVPFLQFTAFLFLARGLFFWAFIPLALGLLLLVSFPTEPMVPSPASKAEWRYAFLMRRAAGTFFGFWIIFQPGVVDLADHLLSSEALWDWRLILAVFVWCLNRSFSNFRKVTNLTDLEILAIYDDPACGKGIQQSEKDVTPNA